MDKLEHALSYCKRGWAVMPVGSDKKPLLKKWKPLQNVAPIPDQLEQWWDRWPEANIGIVTGQISGLVVIDIESETGYDEIKDLLEPTLTARTGGGGWHKYYSYPENVDRVKNAVRLFNDVDVRADGGYVVAPPSDHQSGEKYEWERSGPPKPLPDELLERLRGDDTSGPLSSEDWQDRVKEGRRDDELTRRVGKLLANDIPPNEVYSMVKAWNENHCKPPLPNQQVKKIVKSIARRESAEKSNGQEDDFRVMNWKDTLQTYGLQQTNWLVEDWVTRNALGMVWAPPGQYKTWMLLDLALSVATGRDFLGHYPVDSTGPVLILQQEDPFPMLFSRLGTIANVGKPDFNGEHFEIKLPESDPPIYWHPDRQLHFDNEESVKGLEEAVFDLNPKLVIIDPLYSAAKTDDYMAEAATQMLPLKKMKEEANCSFMIAHHAKKHAGDSKGRQDLWGSQFLNALLETGWQIRPRDLKNTIEINRHFKQAEEPETISLTFHIDEYNYRVELADQDSDKQQVRELVEEGEVSSVAEVADKLGHSGKGSASRCLRELGAEKKNGRYVLPEEE